MRIVCVCVGDGLEGSRNTQEAFIMDSCVGVSTEPLSATGQEIVFVNY